MKKEKKGITHDYNSIEFARNNVKFELIDTPGHKQFIRSLLAGLNLCATNMLIGRIVVSATENEFAAGMGRGQTKEDMILMRAVGIEHVIVVINKMDKYNFDNTVYEDRYKQVDKFISKLGFKTISYMMVSGYTGFGISELLARIEDIYKEITNNVAQVGINNDVIINDIINAQIKIINLDTALMCPGYECILHIKTEEYQVVIEDLKQYDVKLKKEINKNFAKINDVVNVKFKRLDDRKFEVSAGDRVIIRHNDATIGFGKVKL